MDLDDAIKAYRLRLVCRYDDYRTHFRLHDEAVYLQMRLRHGTTLQKTNWQHGRRQVQAAAGLVNRSMVVFVGRKSLHRVSHPTSGTRRELKSTTPKNFTPLRHARLLRRILPRISILFAPLSAKHPRLSILISSIAWLTIVAIKLRTMCASRQPPSNHCLKLY